MPKVFANCPETPCKSNIDKLERIYKGRRRPPAAPTGGGPGGGCARSLVGTYFYMHVVRAGNHVALAGIARSGLDDLPAVFCMFL
jgi:hypothetical protein